MFAIGISSGTDEKCSNGCHSLCWKPGTAKKMTENEEPTRKRRKERSFALFDTIESVLFIILCNLEDGAGTVSSIDINATASSSSCSSS